jgi:hypothetical protein
MSILKQDLVNHAAALEWSLDLSWSTAAFLFFIKIESIHEKDHNPHMNETPVRDFDW